ncbi:hypothetical protein [Roseburia hominis]|uniref:hypothetical protein n=1 Tax=Roseburia hominis TaxID=301301 RepID=UPI0020550886|nr:hypothetical protein [Roseburia hominis]DAV63660.1 MAG TPA: IrrE protein [Caudoviricetes sp.]
MTKYETLLENASDAGVIVDETSHFCGTKIKGLYLDKHIAISKDISTDTEKACILAEELGHHYTATGNILDQSTVENRKQEMRGRIVAYNKLVGLRGIVDAYLHHCQSISESAEYLEVTEEFLIDSLNYYRNKYGVYTKLDNYVIVFEPNIAVLELV